MAKLIIRNVGPIKDINIELNKINVIIGPQSSGKSTINKIACYCTWVEKKISLEQSFDFFMDVDSFKDNLVKFHKLNGYFYPDSYIEYESNVVKFSYLYSENIPHFEWINQYEYVCPKITYIPAERNIVSMISDWGQVNLPNNNIFNFMSDWNMARKSYHYENNLPIDSINAKYFYDETLDLDFLEILNGEKIKLLNASSGQQSLIPLYVLIMHFTKNIYESKEKKIKTDERNIKLTLQLLYHSLDSVVNDRSILNDSKKFQEYLDKNFATTENGKKKLSEKGDAFFSDFLNYFSHYTEINYSSLFIEEPELNLFPSAQKHLLYFMISQIKKKDHRLFFTTHSPYILYALNNCIMGWLVKDNIPQDIANLLESFKSWIDPNKVSAWQIENGSLVSIQERHTNSIGKHYFNKIMNDTMNEYYTMLNYFNPNDYEK